MVDYFLAKKKLFSGDNYLFERYFLLIIENEGLKIDRIL